MRRRFGFAWWSVNLTAKYPDAIPHTGNRSFKDWTEHPVNKGFREKRGRKVNRDCKATKGRKGLPVVTRGRKVNKGQQAQTALG